SRLGRWRAKLRERTRAQHVKVYFPNCLTRFDPDPAILRTRTALAQHNGAPGQNSSRFPLSEHGLPISPFQSKSPGAEFRGAAQVVEAPVATRPPFCRLCLRARCTGTPVR